MSGDDEPIEVQFNRNDHACTVCLALVTSASVDGINQPCGHQAATFVTKPGEA